MSLLFSGVLVLQSGNGLTLQVTDAEENTVPQHFVRDNPVLRIAVPNVEVRSTGSLYARYVKVSEHKWISRAVFNTYNDMLGDVMRFIITGPDGDTLRWSPSVHGLPIPQTVEQKFPVAVSPGDTVVYYVSLDGFHFWEPGTYRIEAVRVMLWGGKEDTLQSGYTIDFVDGGDVYYAYHRADRWSKYVDIMAMTLEQRRKAGQDAYRAFLTKYPSHPYSRLVYIWLIQLLKPLLPQSATDRDTLLDAYFSAFPEHYMLARKDPDVLQTRLVEIQALSEVSLTIREQVAVLRVLAKEKERK